MRADHPLLTAAFLVAGGCATPAGGGATADAAAPPDAGDPYANVVAVMPGGTTGSYTFNVTVESADIDCSQYANYWEVLSADGALIYRRILDHSHTDANGTTDPDQPGNTFTRDGGPVAIGADQRVLVRAHMSRGGYHGQVMGGSVATGFATVTDLPLTFAAGVETQPPQPTTCDF